MRPLTYAFMTLATLPVLAGLARAGVALTTGAEAARYAAHWPAIALHVSCGAAFGLLGALQLDPGLRARRPRWHRGAGRVLVGAGGLAALSALWLNHVFPPVEGAVKAVGVNLVAGFLIVALTLALVQIRRGKAAGHRAWMLRAYAIGLAPALQLIFGLTEAALLGEVPAVVAVSGHYAAWVVTLALAERAIRAGDSRPRLRLRPAR